MTHPARRLTARSFQSAQFPDKREIIPGRILDGLIESNKDGVVPHSSGKENAMYIVVEHTITNPDVFFGLAPKVAEAPSGFIPHQFLPSAGKDRAVCLWEAKSVDALKGFLDPLTGKSSRNTYYAVDSTIAMGLPIKKAAA
jgi:hypothetical protein